MKMIYILLIIGSLILFGALFCLLYLNYNDKIFEQISTFFLSFLILGIGSIAFSLKSDKIEKSFYMYVVVNKNNFQIYNSSILGFDHCNKLWNMAKSFAEYNNCLMAYNEEWTNSKLNSALVNYARLEGIADLEKHLLIDPKLSSIEDAKPYYQELMQYKIITDIRDMNWKYYETNYKYENGIKYFQKRTNLPFSLIDSTVSIDIILKEKTKNRFFESHLDKMMWENKLFEFPSNVSFELKNDTKKKTRSIWLSRNNYFNTGITIEFEGISMDAFPKGLIIDKELSKEYCTLTYLVKLSSDFYKISSLGNKAKKYKEWTNWLFDNLEGKNKL